jgi:hypothetical protein
MNDSALPCDVFLSHSAMDQAVVRSLAGEVAGGRASARLPDGGPGLEGRGESSMPRPAGDKERFVLLAMHQTLVERGFASPPGRKTIAQRFIGGVQAREGNKSREGRKTGFAFRAVSFAPTGLARICWSVFPPMNRWAIFGRP